MRASIGPTEVMVEERTKTASMLRGSDFGSRRNPLSSLRARSDYLIASMRTW